MTSKLCIDLGVGLGGASAAFRDAGWWVVGLDLNRKFKPTICASYTHLPFRTNLNPEVMISAPDCRRFSMAVVYRNWEQTANGPRPKNAETRQAVEDTLALKDEIERVSPDYAPLENPHPGMMCHVLGQPLHKIRQSDYGSPYKKPTGITGIWEFGRKRLRWKWLEFQGNWIKAPRGSKTRIQGKGPRTALGQRHGAFMGVHRKALLPKDLHGLASDYITDASARALWPYGLSRAILEGVEDASPEPSTPTSALLEAPPAPPASISRPGTA